MNFDIKSLNTCTLKAIDGQGADRNRIVRLIRKLKGVPQFFQTQNNYDVKVAKNQDEVRLKNDLNEDIFKVVAKCFEVVDKTGNDYCTPIEGQKNHLLLVKADDRKHAYVINYSQAERPKSTKLKMKRVK